MKFIFIPIFLFSFLSLCLADTHEDAQRLNEEGKKYIESGDLVNAIKSFKEAVILKPDYADVYNNLGLTCAMQGEHKKALEFYETAIRIEPNHFKAHYNSGLIYYDFKKDDKSINSFEKVIEIKPYFVEAYYFLGMTHTRIKQYKEAIKFFEEAIRLKPDYAAAYYFLGLTYHDFGQYQNAVKALKETIILKPDFARAYLFLGESYTKSGQYEEAEKSFAKTISIDSNNDEAHYELALIFSFQKRYEKAMEFIKDAIHLQPDIAVYHNALGYIYYEMAKYENAVTEQKEAIRINPDFGEAFYNLGRSYSNLNQFKKAIEAYKKAITMKPQFSDVYYNDLGFAYASIGQKEKAIEAYTDVIKINPKFVGAHYNLGFTYHDLGEYEKAIESYKEVISIKPDADVYNNIGTTYFDSGEYGKAIESFKNAIKINPDYFLAHYNLGKTYSRVGTLEKAIASFNKAIGISPDFFDAHYRIGLAFTRLEQDEKAIEAYKEALKLKPDDADAYYMLGESYYLLGASYHDLGQFEKSISLYKEAIIIKPDADVYNNLGSAYADLGQYEKALPAYKQAVKLKPDFAKYYHNVGLAYGRLGNQEEAIKYLTEAIRLNPDYIRAHLLLAASYALHDQQEEAINSLKEVIRLDPNNYKAYWRTGLAYSNLKQYKQAIDALKEAITINSDIADTYYLLGLNYSEWGQHQEAIKFFNKAINLQPDNHSAYYALGYSYLSLNDLEKSIEAYKNGLKLHPDHFAYDVLGLVYKDSGQYEKAIESYKEAIRIKPDYYDAYENLMFAYHDLGQNSKAVDYLIEAIKFNPEQPEPRHTLGFFHYILGNLEEAIKYLVDAQNLYRKSSNTTGETITTIVLGEIYTNTGKDIYALDNLNKALTAYEESNYLSGIAGVNNDIASVYFQLADYETSLQYLQKALKIFKQLEDNPSILRILGFISLLKLSIEELSSGNYDETFKYGKQAIEFAEEKGLSNDYNAIISHLAIAGAYFKTDNFSDALKSAEKALVLAKESRKESRNKFTIAFCDFTVGMIYEKLGNYQKAENYMQKSMNSSKTLEQPSLKWMPLWGMGKINEKKSNLTEAKKYYIIAIDILETLRERTQSLASKMSMGIQTSTVYSDTILFLIKIGELEKAFNYMERARSRSFLDLMGRKFRLQNIHASYKEIIEEERQLQFKINYLSEKIGVISKESEKDDITHKKDLIKKELNRARGEYAKLLKKIKKDYPEFSTLLRVETLNQKQVQALLDSDTTLLQYFITPDKTLLSILSKSDLKIIEIEIKDKELTTIVDKFRGKIASLHPDYKKEAEELYDLLIRPARPYIKTKRIGIVPHSVLHYLPFQALLNKDSFLIEEYDIFYTPSASVLKFVYEKRKKITGKTLAFGNPDLGDERLNLPHAEEEVKMIKEIYPETALYMKNKATKEKLKKLSGDYNIIHFASHGELNPENPLFSSIRLAKDKDEDGRLEVHEIFNLNLENTSLVTLSACETGLGKLTKGDELIGLTRSFIFAGTPSIVASLWKVNDSSTSKLMGMFYKNLKNHSKAEALRMAQIEMIRGEVGKGIVRGVGGITTSKESKPRLQAPMTVDGSHPYFWAPFILLGDWQ